MDVWISVFEHLWFRLARLRDLLFKQTHTSTDTNTHTSKTFTATWTQSSPPKHSVSEIRVRFQRWRKSTQHRKGRMQHRRGNQCTVVSLTANCSGAIGCRSGIWHPPAWLPPCAGCRNMLLKKSHCQWRFMPTGVTGGSLGLEISGQKSWRIIQIKRKSIFHKNM